MVRQTSVCIPIEKDEYKFYDSNRDDLFTFFSNSDIVFSYPGKKADPTLIGMHKAEVIALCTSISNTVMKEIKVYHDREMRVYQRDMDKLVVTQGADIGRKRPVKPKSISAVAKYFYPRDSSKFQAFVLVEVIYFIENTTKTSKFYAIDLKDIKDTSPICNIINMIANNR